MSGASIRWDAGGFNAGLQRRAEESDKATLNAVAQGARLIQLQAKKNSSGRPGPNVVSGAHRDGIITEGPRRSGPGAWEARIRGTKIYSDVLERGSRRWRAGVKYPWLEPAVEWARTAGPVAELFREAWRRVHQ